MEMENHIVLSCDITKVELAPEIYRSFQEMRDEPNSKQL